METECFVTKTLSIIGKKWSMLIIQELLGGTMRFTDLEKKLSTISPRTLSQRLKEMETHDLITRTTYPSIPPKVEYTLTSKGMKLSKVILELKHWGQECLKT
jgi:DNA-binding HxlR family transcriptional regulator